MGEMSCTFVSEPTGPMKPRIMNAVHENRNFQSPRGNMPIDNLKPKVRPQEAKSLQPIQTKKVVQNTKILNKGMNQQVKNAEIKPEVKRVMQKSPAATNKTNAQMKKLVPALKNKISIDVANDKELPSPTVAKKVLKVPAQVQKSKPIENTVANENTRIENDSSPSKKAQDNDTPVANSKKNTSAPDTKSQENSTTTKSAPETQENKHRGAESEDKVSTANSADKQTTNQSKTEVPLEQKSELDPLLARAVEEELQDIMIQVWQELPDDPLEEEDRIAVEKLRNEAGDDLRRVLGLNITKRLLNVYNNLFVKLQFTCRPQMGCLTKFLNEYHIAKFKRIDKNSNTFAAQIENIDDFDRVCAAKELMCGEAKITVTPCYKFTQCPENLKTIYDDTYFYEDTNTQKTKDTAPNEKVVKQSAKSETSPWKSIEKSDKAEVQKISNSVHKDSNNVKKDSAVIDNNKITDSSKIITENSKSKETSKDILLKDKDLIEFIIKDKLESDNGDDEFDQEVPEYQMEGEDELNDEDILALMSEGVVLDECSGSEDEH